MTQVYLVDFGGEYEIRAVEDDGLMADGLMADEVQEYIQVDGEVWAEVVETRQA